MDTKTYVNELIDRVLNGQETESEIGRVRAYRTCVNYAEMHLAKSHVCNTFLFEAAKRLRQPPMAIPVVYHRHPVPDDAKICVYPTDDEGIVLVGNAEGLRYLGGVLSDLANSPMTGDRIDMGPGLEETPGPITPTSDDLTLYIEDENWFDIAVGDADGPIDDGEWLPEFDGRIVNASEVAAVQFETILNTRLAIAPRKIYRVHGVSPYKSGAADVYCQFTGPADSSCYAFHLINDDGHPLKLGLRLDDPDVVFYYAWHLEQLAGLSPDKSQRAGDAPTPPTDEPGPDEPSD